MKKETFEPRRFIILLLLMIITSAAHTQQVADTLFNPPIPNPAHGINEGPVVFIDEAHGNFHTMSGRFRPFASILQRDGYIVKGFKETFSGDKLSQGKILVIANALHASNQGQWSLPTPSAFTAEEIAEVNKWVKEGGSLFLMADHMPFPGAAEQLVASFGFKFFNGFAMKKRNSGKDIFSPGQGLHENVITNGRNASEKITSLQSFTGQAFEIPAEASAIVILNDDYEILLPKTAWQFGKNTEKMSADKLVQGAYMKYGNGKVVVFGEAGMFTAQTQGGKNKFGMNAKSAPQNVQFLLNVIHWLDE